MAFPDISSVLQGVGFRHSADSSYQIQRSASGNCVFIFGWDVSSVRVWYSLFLAECLDITLYYVCICKQSAVVGPTAGATPATPAPPSEPVPAPAPAGGAPAGGPTAAAPKPADENWIVTYVRKASEESCSFGSAKDLTNTDYQNLFNTKMGLQLPPAPTPATR